MKEFGFLASRYPGFHPRLLVTQGALFGVAMIGIAWVVAVVIQGRDVSVWFPRRAWGIDLLIGSSAGGAFALVAWGLLEVVPPLKRIETLLIRLLDMGAMRPRHALLLGLVAGIPEEILFRGAIQPLLGLVGTSLLFGALHAMTPAYFVYASAASLLLGELAIWRGGLWASMAAHVAIDTLMLLLLIQVWRRSQPKQSSNGHGGHEIRRNLGFAGIRGTLAQLDNQRPSHPCPCLEWDFLCVRHRRSIVIQPATKQLFLMEDSRVK